MSERLTAEQLLAGMGGHSYSKEDCEHIAEVMRQYGMREVQAEKREWYKKLRKKLHLIKTGKLDLDEYFEEVREKSI